MSYKWDRIATGDLFDLINGFAFKSGDFAKSGAPVLKIKNIKAGRLRLDSLSYVSTSFLTARAEKVTKKNDLLISMTGNRHDGSMDTWVGKVCYFGGSEEYLINQRVGILRAKPDANINSRFFGYQLASKSFQKYFISVATSSGGQANLSPDQIKSTELIAPPKPVQDRIVRIVGSLEDKLKVNQRINETLEQIAQALFKSWFVDFEPVNAKMAALEKGGTAEDAERAAMQGISGKSATELDTLKTHYPDQYDNLVQTAELFPSAMVESQLGEIPEGWDVGSVSDVATLEIRSVKPANAPDEVWEHYSIPAYDDGQYPTFDLGKEIKSNKYQVPDSAILVSKLNPRFPRKWWPLVIDSGVSICSTEFMPFVSVEEGWRGFVAGLVLSEPFQRGMLERVSGSTGSRQRAQPREVKKMPVILPDRDLIEAFSKRVTPLFEKSAQNIKESRTLSELRDTLLPRLLSGELTVPEVEERIPEPANV